MNFTKVTKKYALNNSYFKNRTPNAPRDPFQILEYYKQHAELPYDNGDMTDNWFYECFVEYQKRAGVYNSQFFTPQSTAEKLAKIALGYTRDENTRILDACCGFGQITKELIKQELKQITAFDFDPELRRACEYFCGDNAKIFTENFKDDDNLKDVRGSKYDIVVSNPPYETKDLTEFFYFLNDVLYEGGYAILLIPSGFLDKSRPKRLVEILNEFHIIDRIPMQEEFVRTKVRAEIVIIQK